jgi:hypothetical protein
MVESVFEVEKGKSAAGTWSMSIVHYCEHDPKKRKKLNKKETNSYGKLLITENYYSLDPEVAG